MQHIIVLQICNLEANLKKLVEKNDDHKYFEFQNRERGAMYYEITIKAEEKSLAQYHAEIHKFLGLASRFLSANIYIVYWAKHMINSHSLR